MKKNHDFGHCSSNAWIKTLRVMKLTAILFFLAIFTVAAEGYSQGTRISMKMEDPSLKEVFKELKSLSDYTFVYSEGMVADVNIDEINFQEVSVEEALNECLESTDLEYYIENSVVVIRKKAPVVEQPVQQQKKTIKGKVTDKEGVPLPGVSVVVKGTTLGVATDIDGNYSLEFEGENAVLVYSFVGMVPQEIKYTGQALQNVSLLADTETMDEVVVTGYQTISSERATGSFTNVNVEEVLEQKTTDNVLNIINGEVTGLLFDTPTTEGGTPDIVMRGVNSFSYNDPDELMPLVVVDGFPVNGVSDQGDRWGDDFYQIMQNIDPNDIENVSVLKDAAAASIWGASAANGVIVITTKKGKKSDKPKVTFSSSLSFKNKPDYKDTYRADLNTFLELEEWYANNRMRAPSKSSTRYTSPAAEIYYDFAQIADPTAEDIAAKDAAINELKKNDFIKEYSDLFLRNYTRQQYALSISQGSDKYNYYASLKYKDEKESVKRVGNQDYSALINLSANLAKGVKLSTKLTYSKKDVQNNRPTNHGVFTEYERILGDNGEQLDMPYTYNQFTLDRYESDGRPYDYHYNIVEEHQLKDNTNEIINNNFQTKLDIDLFKGLRAELSYNYQFGSNKGVNFRNEKSYDVRSTINSTAIYEAIDPSRPRMGVVGTGKTYLPLGNILEGEDYAAWSSDYRAMLNYSDYLDAAKEHFVTALAGIDYRDERTESRVLETLYGYNTQTLNYKSFNKQGTYMTDRGYESQIRNTVNEASLKKNKNRYLSNYFNASYTYKEKYTVTGSWRLDDSNLFGSSDKYRNVPLWSMGMKWRMKDESFMNVPFLNRLDVRVSYGTGGRIDRGSSPFLTIEMWNSRETSVDFAMVRTWENEELRWETTTTFNVGVDYALFNNRLSGTIEYYSRYTKDLLGSVEMNPTFGVVGMSRNYGEISNKGVEMSLNGTVLQNKDLRWNMSLLLSHNKNKVEVLESSETVSNYVNGIAKQGHGMDEFYAFRWAGLSNTGTAQAFDKDGNIVGIDEPLAEIDDLVFIGQKTPKVYGTYRNSVSYKGLTLDVLLSYKFGHKFFRNTFGSTDAIHGTRSKTFHEDAANRWKEPGDENRTDIPALAKSNGSGYYYEKYSDRLVEDASHIRIQSIGLNYKLNKKLFENNFIEGVSIGINALNLGLLWKATDKDIDPEYNNFASTFKGNRAIYSCNLKVNF
ncbi:SusC/RagA family TonB-linked outer membrane protein [Marinifilum sp.]|uniref:SusC/RagA family TonB-linked outer membrane protein n=1 Tax=Marinifilum sp. TaxID=2033137 RepID=UPI003BAD1BD5